MSVAITFKKTGSLTLVLKTPSEISSELEVIERCKEDPQHFRILYDRYFPDIFRFVYRRMGDREIAADVTSQVFVKALSAIPGYRNTGVPFSAWVYRIAINEINSFYRKSKKERVIRVEDADLQNLTHELPSDHQDERLAQLLAVVSTLEPENVYLLELRFFEGRSFREMGEILELKEVTVKKKVHRLLLKIKGKLKNSAS